jgi:hypothetical protein
MFDRILASTLAIGIAGAAHAETDSIYRCQHRHEHCFVIPKLFA